MHALLEHSNRGKRSLGLDLADPDGLDILYQVAATCDVFLTNKLQGVRDEAPDRRRRHPRGQPEHHLRARLRQGNEGPDADKGSYDSLAFWARAGIAYDARTDPRRR